MQVDVRVDARQALARLEALGPRVYGPSVARALNRTAGTVRKVAGKEIKDGLGGVLKSRYVKALMAIRPRATRSSLIAGVRALGRKYIPVGTFDPVQTYGGTYVKIGKRRVFINHAWVAHPKGWARPAVRVRSADWKGQLVDHVVVRRKRIARGGPDNPIAEILVPGVPALFVEKRLQNVMTITARKRFPEVLAQELRYQLSK